MYVTLGRLEQAGLLSSVREADGERPERRTYELTPAGRERVEEWLTDVTWPRPDLANFHLKLVVAAAGRLADPVEVIGSQRRELVRRLRDAQRAALAEPEGSDASLLLEGVVLRTEADLHWLDSCERAWGAGR
jgi:DNA-binding PadR family transcriptional regulator